MIITTINQSILFSFQSATPLSKVEPPQVVYDTLATQTSAKASTQAGMSATGVSKFPEVNKILADPAIQEKIRTKPAYKNYAAFLEKSYTYQVNKKTFTSWIAFYKENFVTKNLFFII